MIETYWFECQDCGFKGNSRDFTKIENAEDDFDVDFCCPKCKSINIKRRIGMIDDTKEVKMIWYGNAGHFCGCRKCEFHLCTEVGKYLISTVGEYRPDGIDKPMESLSTTPNMFYETMVLELNGSRCKCGCGLPDVHLSALEVDRYETPKEANEKHLEYCKKYAEKVKNELS